MKRWILDNHVTKLMALFLAILLWVYLDSIAMGEKEETAVFRPTTSEKISQKYHVEYRRHDAAGDLLDPNFSTVRLTVRAPRSDIESLRRKRFLFEPVLEADSFGSTSGSFFHTPAPQDFELSSQFTLSTDPERIYVRYEPYVERMLPLQASTSDVRGIPRSDCVIESVTCTPSEIRVALPEELGKTVTALQILKIPVDGRPPGNFTVPGQIDPKQAGGVEVRMLPDQGFYVQVTIGTIPDTKDFKAVPLLVAGDSDVLRRIRLDTPTIDVRVKGPRSVVEKLTEDDFRVFVPVFLKRGELPAGGGPRTEKNVRHYLFNQALRSELKFEFMHTLPEDKREVVYMILPETP